MVNAGRSPFIPFPCLSLVSRALDKQLVATDQNCVFVVWVWTHSQPLRFGVLLFLRWINFPSNCTGTEIRFRPASRRQTGHISHVAMFRASCREVSDHRSVSTFLPHLLTAVPPNRQPRSGHGTARLEFRQSAVRQGDGLGPERRHKIPFVYRELYGSLHYLSVSHQKLGPTQPTVGGASCPALRCVSPRSIRGYKSFLVAEAR